jgi:HlyD family secretion protein
MRYFSLLGCFGLILIASCGNKQNDFDASGNFEADEVIVSAQQSGQILSFNLQEGDTLAAGMPVGQIDVTIPRLQMEQVEASIRSLHEKTSSVVQVNDLVKKQLAVQEVELEHQQRERERTANLVRADAATRKQLDDIDALIVQLQKQITVTRQQLNVNATNTQTQNNGILSEKAPLEKAVAQYQEQIGKGSVINPVRGIVLSKYAFTGEMAMTGKPLYKVANTDTLTLRAYLAGNDLSRIRIGQSVVVRIDSGGSHYKNYPGLLSWVSAKSEFTPKTIQTKNQRADLVYAIKVRVKNDGFLKIGMYGEVLLNTNQN